MYLFKWEWWRLNLEKVVISRCFISFSIDQMQNCCLLTHKKMGWRNAKKIAFVATVNEGSDSTFHNRIQWAFRPEFSLKKVSAITSQSVWNIWISSILHWMCLLTKAYFNLSMDCKFKTICILPKKIFYGKMSPDMMCCLEKSMVFLEKKF